MQSVGMVEDLALALCDYMQAKAQPMHMDDMRLVGEYLLRRGKGGLRSWKLDVKWDQAPPQSMIEAVRAGAYCGMEDTRFLPPGWAQRWQALIPALVEGGGCPLVTEVDIARPPQLEALAAGAFPAVEKIHCIGYLAMDGVRALLKLLVADKLPCLRELMLRCQDPMAQGLMPLWQYAVSGGLGRVRSLNIIGRARHDRLISLLIEAIEGGGLAALRRLRLLGGHMTDQAAGLVGQALIRGLLGGLEDLDLSLEISAAGLAFLAQALGQCSMPNLRRLGMPRVDSAGGVCDSIVDAIERPRFPRLKSIYGVHVHSRGELAYKIKSKEGMRWIDSSMSSW